MITTVLDVPLAKIRPFAGQPRKHFDKAALADLRSSIAAVGQQVPVTLRPLTDEAPYAYELVDGERRFRVCQELKKPTIRAWVRADLAAGGPEQLLASIVSNFARAEHTAMEIAEAVLVLEQRPDIQALPTPGARMARIGAIFGRSPTWAQNYKTLSQLIPEARAQLAPPMPERKGIPFNAALMLAVLPAADQRDVVREIRTRKLSGKRAAALIRNRRLGAKVAGSELNQPARNYARIASVFGSVASTLEALLSEPMSVWRSAIGSRKAIDQQRLLRNLELVVGQLGEFHQAVRRIVVREAS